MKLLAKVVTVSDSVAVGGDDESGPAVVELLERAAWEVVESVVVADGRANVGKALARAVDGFHGVVVTTGGTGLSPRDQTPEATSDVIDRSVPGISEAIRAAGITRFPHAMLSRAVAGTVGRSLIINLSGSPKAACEQLAVVEPVLAHALEVLAQGPAERVEHPEHDGTGADRTGHQSGAGSQPGARPQPGTGRQPGAGRQPGTGR